MTSNQYCCSGKRKIYVHGVFGLREQTTGVDSTDRSLRQRQEGRHGAQLRRFRKSLHCLVWILHIKKHLLCLRQKSCFDHNPSHIVFCFVQQSNINCWPKINIYIYIYEYKRKYTIYQKDIVHVSLVLTILQFLWWTALNKHLSVVCRIAVLWHIVLHIQSKHYTELCLAVRVNRFVCTVLPTPAIVFCCMVAGDGISCFPFWESH